MPDDWIEPNAPEWPAGVRALTTTRRFARGHANGLDGWNLAAHVGDDPDAVAANRRTLIVETGVRAVQWLTQVHGTRCIEASAATTAEAPEADAAWTAERGLGLAVLTADCVPVVLAHRRADLVGVAHGGWRGLVGGVLENLVAALPAEPRDLVGWLGPAIGPDAYEVGDDVVSAVSALHDGDRLAREVFRAGHAGKSLLDLFALSARLLARAGVPVVLSERLCTWSDPRFFSYRRDGRTGRMATVAWLE